MASFSMFVKSGCQKSSINTTLHLPLTPLCLAECMKESSNIVHLPSCQLRLSPFTANVHPSGILKPTINKTLVFDIYELMLAHKV